MSALSHTFLPPAAPAAPMSARTAVRRLALGRLISIAGTDASGIALGWALYEQTGSAMWISFSLLLTIGGGSLLGPIGGWIADRVDRRRLMIACEATSALLFLLLVFMHSPAALLAVSVFATASGAAFGPAAGAAVAHLADERELAWANGVLSTGGNLGRMGGRLAAGLLVAALGAHAVFALDALTFAVSAALTASVRLPFGGAGAAVRAASQGFGFRELAAQPVLRLLALSACVSTLVTSFSMTAEVPLAVELGAGAIGLGVLTAGWGAGMVLGSWHAGRALSSDNEATGVLAGRALMALGIGLTAVAPTLPVATLCYLLGGLGGGFMGVGAQSLIMRRTPEHMRARMLAAVDACRNLAFGVGALSAGVVVTLCGPRLVYGLVGLGVLAGCVPIAALVRRLGGPRSLRPVAATV
jgi:MFS family permease